MTERHMLACSELEINMFDIEKVKFFFLKNNYKNY
jgi:hypothetical protein